MQASQSYEQVPQLFWNQGADARSCFTEVPAEQLGDLGSPMVGRGAAFADIDGVIEVRAGEPLASDRPVVDDSFDVGITIRFASAEDMRAYLVDERHVRAVEEVLGPLTDRYRVYDFIDPGALGDVAD